MGKVHLLFIRFVIAAKENPVITSILSLFGFLDVAFKINDTFSGASAVLSLLS